MNYEERRRLMRLNNVPCDSPAAGEARQRPRMSEAAYFLRMRARLPRGFTLDDIYYPEEQQRFFARYERQMKSFFVLNTR